MNNEMMNNKLEFLLNKQADLEKEKAIQTRVKAAKFLFKNIENGGDWLKIETLKLLYFYKDLDFVNERLEQYRLENMKNLSSKVKAVMEQFFSDNLDVKDIISKRRRQDKLRAELAELKRSVKTKSEIEAQSEITELNLVQMKFCNIR